MKIKNVDLRKFWFGYVVEVERPDMPPLYVASYQNGDYAYTPDYRSAKRYSREETPAKHVHQILAANEMSL